MLDFLETEWVIRTFLSLYVLVLLVLCFYGLHRFLLVHLYYKHRRNVPRLTACFRELPRVTIQLPMYNEQAVARRIIDATCRIDYPRHLLDIQVLDDSTDETVEVCRSAVAEWAASGLDITHLHRTNREGYKAGALAEGLKSARGEYVLIFDADFIPPSDILQRTIHYFTAPSVGMVQARWEHLNRDQSLLTKGEAILLDGHFVIEHGARNRSGRFMSFNGTAGMWRKACIDDAGGWQHDTLTEDLDLSYRAQMKGWKFLFLPELTSPAELPPDMEAFKQQQYRWAKGGAQTCRKLLPAILRSRLPKRIKLEAFFHLTNCTVYLYMVFLILLMFPVVYYRVHEVEALADGPLRYTFDASILLLATFSGATFYVASQRELFRSWSDSLKYIPLLISLGVGICLNNARAVIMGFFGKPSEFVRTPKYGVDQTASVRWKQMVRNDRRKRAWRMDFQPWVELALGLYLMGCLILCLLERKVTIGMPFLILFMVGYLYVPLMTWFGHRLGRTSDLPRPDALPAAMAVDRHRLYAAARGRRAATHEVPPASSPSTMKLEESNRYRNET